MYKMRKYWKGGTYYNPSSKEEDIKLGDLKSVQRGDICPLPLYGGQDFSRTDVEEGILDRREREDQ